MGAVEVDIFSRKEQVTGHRNNRWWPVNLFSSSLPDNDQKVVGKSSPSCASVSHMSRELFFVLLIVGPKGRASVGTLLRLGSSSISSFLFPYRHAEEKAEIDCRRAQRSVQEDARREGRT